jgi:hypothetical protein
MPTSGGERKPGRLTLRAMIGDKIYAQIRTTNHALGEVGASSEMRRTAYGESEMRRPVCQNGGCESVD